jgi:hypothetical protein
MNFQCGWWKYSVNPIWLKFCFKWSVDRVEVAVWGNCLLSNCIHRVSKNGFYAQVICVPYLGNNKNNAFVQGNLNCWEIVSPV